MQKNESVNFLVISGDTFINSTVLPSVNSKQCTVAIQHVKQRQRFECEISLSFFLTGSKFKQILENPCFLWYNG